MNEFSFSLKRTETSLRRLLEDVFASNDLLTVDELIALIESTIEVPILFLVYIREKSWFQPGGEFLTFNYLSFERSGGPIVRFATHFDLATREQELLASAYQIRDSRLCRILYKVDFNYDYVRVLNLIQRIMVSFYTNCGTRDQFRQSVSERFVREFFRSSDPVDDKSLTWFIRRRINIDVTLWKPRNEIYFSATPHLPCRDLVSPLTGEYHRTEPLFDDATFGDDLRHSVLRKTQTSGATQNGSQYIIQTFVRHTLPSRGTSNHGGYRVQQNAVAIFQSKTKERIQLDRVFHACAIIEKYLQAIESTRLERIFPEAQRRCAEQEFVIAGRPIENHASLLDTFSKTIAEMLTEVGSIANADAISVWMFDPFDNQLNLRHYNDLRRSVNESWEHATIDLDQSDHVASQCFTTGRGIFLMHPRWIELELRQIQNRPSESVKPPRLREFKEQRTLLSNSGNCQDCAAAAIPIYRGDLIIGVLELVSGEVGDLRLFSPLLEDAAQFCGEALRRIELANDRAWLSRISFIHNIRHRVEKMLRLVEVTGDAGKDLADLIRSGGPPAPPEAPSMHALTRIRHHISAHSGPEAVDRWIQELRTAYPDIEHERTGEDIADIVEALESNHKHSNFELGSLQIRAVARSHTSGEHVQVSYVPSNVWIQLRRMIRLGISPLPSETNLTYHIGLFLLSVQLRMIGGVVYARYCVDDIDNAAFGVTFFVPRRRCS